MANNDEPVVPQSEPLPIVDGTPVRQRTGGHWLHLVIYLITSLIFAFFLVLAGRWVYHQTHHKSQIATTSTSNSNPAPATRNTPAAPSAPVPPASNAQGNKPSTPSGSKQSQPTTKPSQPTQPSQPSTNPAPTRTPSSPIPNTGPGNIAAIFLIVSIVIAALHYILRPRMGR